MPRKSKLGEFGRTYLLLVGLSLPLWLLGALDHRQILPGLPLSALMFLCPGLALVLARWKKEGRGVLRSVLRPFALGQGRRGAQGLSLAAAFLIMPLLMTLCAIFDHLRGSIPELSLPAPLSLVLLCGLFLVSALGEELFWTGATLPGRASTERWSLALRIAAAYTLWHLLPFLQTGHAPGWVLGQALFSFAFRLLIVEAYFALGEAALGAVLIHASYNLSWQAYPVAGSYYNPWLCLGAVIAAIALLEVHNHKKLSKT